MATREPDATGAKPPLVFISYSRKDERWRERLRLYLKPAEQSGRVSVWDDSLITSGELWNDKIEEAIRQATVAVLLVSPEYLASDWVTNREVPTLLDRQQREGNLRILPILLRPSNWQAVDWLSRIQLYPPDGKPIVGRARSTQDRLFAEAARLIIEFATKHTPSPTYAPPQTPRPSVQRQPARPASPGGPKESLAVEHLANFSQNGEVSVITAWASLLAAYAGEDEGLVTTSCLLFAMAEMGRYDAEQFRTPQFLWHELTKGGEQSYREYFLLKFPRAKYPPGLAAAGPGAVGVAGRGVSRNVIEVFRAASEIAKRTERKAPAGTDPAAAGPTSDRALFRAGEISARHLLAALLVSEPGGEPTGAVRRLVKMLPGLAALRRNFLEFVIISLPQDDHHAWREILLPGEFSSPPPVAPAHEGAEAEATGEGAGAAGEAGAASTPEAVFTPESARKWRAPVAGFLTDYWQGEDLLGITADVNAFAALAAAWSVEPPLSIGLFGDWGSGKTHFMRQMRARVEKLSRAARESGLPQNKVGYYKNIVQIEFNAWHYIEGNLWASLVEHIFANLKLTETEDTSLTESRRAELMKRLGVTKQLQEKVDERKKQLKAEEMGARERAQEALDRREDTSKGLALLRDRLRSSVLDQLNLPLELSPAQKALLEQLGVPSASLTSAAELHKKYLEVKSLWGRVRAQLSIFRNDPRRARRLAVPLALVAVPLLVGVGLGLLYPALTSKRLSGLSAVAGPALTFVLTFMVSARPYWRKFKSGLSLLEEKNREIDDERRKRITELENEVSVLTRQYLDAEREAESIHRQVEELEAEVAGMNAGKMLAEFIEDRAACSDYRRHLGVLALIRRDFEQLAALFKEQREDERAGKGPGGARAINRIILYIDDLDRCPPDRVVQVLQAIHLLLAFPLFVVVVGVDARWVTRSLRESYEWLHDEDGGGEAAGRANNREARGATPHDYLEKIFQIPFWLKPMGDEVCKQFIDGLTRDSRATAEEAWARSVRDEAGGGRGPDDSGPSNAAPPRPREATTRPEVEPAGLGGAPPTQVVAEPRAEDAGAGAGAREDATLTDVPTGGETKSEAAAETEASDAAPATEAVTGAQAAGDEEIDLEPQSLKLGGEEIAYMKELTPLIARSPRAVKRFLNCYRLIRVRLSAAELAAFLGGEGRGGMYKPVMLLLGIVTGAPSIAAHLIEKLETTGRTKGDVTRARFLAWLEADAKIYGEKDWSRVREFLESHVEENDFPALLDALTAVAPLVSRYSFRVARLEEARPKVERNGREDKSLPLTE